jgi:hypothetical protein
MVKIKVDAFYLAVAIKRRCINLVSSGSAIAFTVHIMFTARTRCRNLGLCKILIIKVLIVSEQKTFVSHVPAAEVRYSFVMRRRQYLIVVRTHCRGHPNYSTF